MAQRKRATGFALMDTAFAADAKFVRLARKASSELEFAASVGVFWLILADARRSRSATVSWDDYTEYAAQIAALQDAKLLTSDGFEVTTFDNWAPAYKSPWDKDRAPIESDDATVRNGTHEVRKGTQATPTSTLLTSTLLSSPLPTVSEVVPSAREALPAEDDSATLACRLLMDGGRWLSDREYVTAWDDLDRRYTPEWVQSEIQPAVADLTAKGKVRAWDLKRMVDHRCAERSRTEDTERERRVAEAQRVESDRLRQRAESATAEEKQRAATVRRAVGLWIKQRPTEPVPTEYAQLAAWLAQNGVQA